MIDPASERYECCHEPVNGYPFCPEHGGDPEPAGEWRVEEIKALTQSKARAATVEVILNGLRAYAPDEVESYGRVEAEMIADYVVPFVADAVAQAVKERDMHAHTLEDMWHMTCEAHPWLEWPHDDCSGFGMPVSTSLWVLKEQTEENVRLVESIKELLTLAKMDKEEIARLRAALALY